MIVVVEMWPCDEVVMIQTVGLMRTRIRREEDKDDDDGKEDDDDDYGLFYDADAFQVWLLGH